LARRAQPATPASSATDNAHAADVGVLGEAVYVNYGRPKDYEQLAKMGIDVGGKIVIATKGPTQGPAVRRHEVIRQGPAFRRSL